MMLPAWHEEPIARHHDRAAFDCGGAKTFFAINDEVAQWYARYGTVPLLDTSPSLLLRFKTIHAVFT